MRWFLVDKFFDITPHKTLKASKLISYNESFYGTHFPWKPIFPSTLLLEMMAQAGGVLAGISLGFSKEVILGKVERAEFLREVMPPRALEITAKLVTEDEQAAWAEMKMTDEKGEVASAKIMFVFLDTFKTTDSEGSIVFNEAFLKNFGLMEYKKGEALVTL